MKVTGHKTESIYKRYAIADVVSLGLRALSIRERLRALIPCSNNTLHPWRERVGIEPTYPGSSRAARF